MLSRILYDVDSKISALAVIREQKGGHILIYPILSY
jgi:hypothetical protein